VNTEVSNYDFFADQYGWDDKPMNNSNFDLTSWLNTVTNAAGGFLTAKEKAKQAKKQQPLSLASLMPILLLGGLALGALFVISLVVSRR
jgi:hypothetical protein